jgi:hypothetical protein
MVKSNFHAAFKDAFPAVIFFAGKKSLRSRPRLVRMSHVPAKDME